jgi:hypothetical protein
MKWSIDPYYQRQLFKACYTAINDACCSTILGEPQIVANLVWSLPRAINDIANLAGWALQSSGVFVHAQPFVKCEDFPDSSSSSVEIGDLLLLRTEVHGTQVTGRRALLLQTKKVSGFPVKPDNENQLHLYATWPSFEYVRSTTDLNGKKRHITGLDLYDASRYLLIADHVHSSPRYCHLIYPHHCCVLTASPTMPELSHYRCFVSELIDFLLGDAGKVFNTPPPARTRNWDRVIEDLINVTAKRVSVFMGRAAGSTTLARGQGLFFLSGVQLANQGILYGLLGDEHSLDENTNDGPPRVPAERMWVDNQSDGISIIEFIISKEVRAE